MLRWRGSSHRVVVVGGAFVTLRPADGGDDIEVLRADLQYEAEPATARSAAQLLDLRVLDDLSKADRLVVDVWLEELERLDALVADGTKKADAYVVVAESVNQRLGTSYAPVKVQRQRKALAEHGVPGLLDQRRFGLADARPRSQDPRLIEAVVAVKEAQTRKATGTRGRVIWLTQLELERTHGPGVVPMPSRATMYRLLNELDAGEHTFGSALTRRTASNQPRHMHGVTSGMRPGERVLIDTTAMEILVECDGDQVRPDLTILLDEASRSVLAAIVTVGTRSIDIVVVLARALVPYGSRPEAVHVNRRNIARAWIGDDDALSEQFEDMRHAQPYIFPETITTDRGSSYVSRHFSDACRSLGISLNLAAKYTPTHKAKVETMFDTIKDLFTQYSIGFVGENPAMRGDELVPTDQLLTLEQLQELLDDWIAVTWQNRPHSALRDPRNPRFVLSPNQMVAAYREIAPELQIPMDADRYIALLPIEWRVINAYGVTDGHRRYDSDRLNGMRRKRSPHKHQDGKWPVHIDPYNPMTVWLEADGELIPLTWRSPFNGAPMADEIWRVARAQATARGEDTPTADDLDEVMRRYMNAGNKPKSRRQGQREKVTRADPLQLTNQIAGETPAEPAAVGLAVPEDGDVAAPEPRSWPLAAPFGTTRPAEEA